ncbi:MAG: fructose-6-phosphate aldolase [Candidatus Sericytochromatia bacterium]|nr:fructose-6-phosphate aldolase [Candidatus Sericytochromatia bacterium]
MKFFLDTGNVAEIRKAADLGMLDGVTTNPSLVMKEGVDHESLIREIVALCSGPVSAEAISLDHDGMMAEARRFVTWAPNVVVKLPLTPEGLRAVRSCASEGIKTNVTLCFSVNQALLAAKAGATMVSPFVGRVDDVGQDGMALIAEILQMFRHYGMATEVLVASVRHPRHVAQAALLGAHICTMPFKILEQLYQHPLTDVGVEKFLKDWEQHRKAVAVV